MSIERKYQYLYNRAIWRGPNGVRRLQLRRHPLCQVTGCTRRAVAVDHRKKHNGNFFLFCGGTNLENLRSLCAEHHDAKPDRYETGKEDFNPISATGAQGRQFQSSSVNSEQLNKALDFDKDELLRDIPE